NFNGAVITNNFSAMNWLTNRSSVGSFSESFAFSPNGLRTGMTNGATSCGYELDLRDRVKKKTVTWTNGPTISLNYRMDANGAVTNIWSSSTNGVNLGYELDAQSRVQTVTANGSFAASYQYDTAGALRGMSYGNSITNSFQTDLVNRLTNLVWKSNSLTLASFSYQLGKTGNRTNLTETLLTSATNRVYSWDYDKLYRLTAETISGIGGNSYGLDKVGNRTNRTAGLDGLPAQSFSYNGNDRLTT